MNIQSPFSFTSIKKTVLSILPTHCPLCGMRSYEGKCCKGCVADLPWLDNACQRCGYLLSWGAQNCGECIKRSPPYDRTVTLFRYEPPVDQVLLSVKFMKHLAYAQILGEMMREKIKASYQHSELPTLILPVPLHKKRLKERGYNQAVEIIRPAAKQFGIPLSLHDCVRVLETQSQTKVPANKRTQNVKNAFALTKKIRATHVAIFDDVVTTGSTVAEITRLLKKNGVTRVDIWCCARTLI